MLNFFAIIALGFFLGMRHATDADHVIAVSTIVTAQRSRRSAAWIGALWGLGHTVTIALVGCAIILFGLVIPPRLGLALELAVGVMLVVLGFLSLRGGWPAASGDVHVHAHAHGDYVHTHAHGHAPEAHPHAPDQTPLSRLDRSLAALKPYQFARPLIVGLVHGLAGSAAVALLVMTTIRDPRWAAAYLLVFGFGTILGMMLITFGLASAIHFTRERSGAFSRHLRFAAGVLSVVFGLFVAWQIMVGGGIFTAAPIWTPK